MWHGKKLKMNTAYKHLQNICFYWLMATQSYVFLILAMLQRHFLTRIIIRISNFSEYRGGPGVLRRAATSLLMGIDLVDNRIKMLLQKGYKLQSNLIRPAVWVVDG